MVHFTFFFIFLPFYRHILPWGVYIRVEEHPYNFDSPSLWTTLNNE